MEFGVVVPCSWTPKQIMKTATFAEEKELDFFLLTDHYLSRHSPSTVDSWTMLSAVSANTERIQIGTCVSPIPFRPPSILAKIVSTVDNVSNGRVIFGVGAGWYQPEFEAFSVWDDNRVRAAKTIEGLELILALWTNDKPINFEGKYFKMKEALLEPKPIQKPYVRTWIGSTGKYLLRKCSKYAESWVPSFLGESLDSYKGVISTLKEIESDQNSSHPIGIKCNGTIEEINQRIESFINLGCNGVILARTYYAEIFDSIERLTRDILPSFR